VTRSTGLLRGTRALALACAWAALHAPAAHARTLHWSAFDVAAKLEADGRLHVTERQSIVFDGDWNGGERRFRLLGSQRLELVGIRRIEAATGAAVALHRGKLDKVDDYAFTDSTTLRWRSRRPSDPPFRSTTLVYELEYVLRNVLRQDGDTYILDHDFAFPDRGGAIEAFSLELRLDSAWSPPEGVDSPLRLTKTAMPSGTGALVTLRLGYRGAGAPASVAPPPRVRERLSPLWLAPVALALLAFAAVRFRRYLAHEQRNGRFAPLLPVESIDDVWLAAHVFKYPPEKIGSLWDDRVGAAEVAAVLARLVQEGKLKSRIDKHGRLFGRDVLYLEMPTPHPEWNAYEDALIKALFVEGDTTDTDRIRKHYERAHKTFDPGAILRRYLRVDDRLSDENRAAIAGGWKLSAALALGALVAFGTSVYAESRVEISPEFVLLSALLVVPSLIFCIALTLIGLALRHEVVHPRPRLSALLIVYSVYVVVLMLASWVASAYLGAPVLVLSAALGALLCNLGLNRALTRVNPSHLAERRNLTAARAYFAAIGAPRSASRGRVVSLLARARARPGDGSVVQALRAGRANGFDELGRIRARLLVARRRVRNLERRRRRVRGRRCVGRMGRGCRHDGGRSLGGGVGRWRWWWRRRRRRQLGRRWRWRLGRRAAHTTARVRAAPHDLAKTNECSRTACPRPSPPWRRPSCVSARSPRGRNPLNPARRGPARCAAMSSSAHRATRIVSRTPGRSPARRR
jgi:hypothetical protein